MYIQYNLYLSTECATGSEFRDLISEFTLLKDVSHNNVIKLLGVCSTGGNHPLSGVMLPTPPSCGVVPPGHLPK